MNTTKFTIGDKVKINPQYMDADTFSVKFQVFEVLFSNPVDESHNDYGLVYISGDGHGMYINPKFLIKQNEQH